MHVVVGEFRSFSPRQSFWSVSPAAWDERTTCYLYALESLSNNMNLWIISGFKGLT